MTPEQEQAIELLSVIDQKDTAYTEINKAIEAADLSGFYSNFSPVNVDIRAATVKLIDMILGEDIGSYWLYETRAMKGGGSITIDGRKWQIETLDDVRAYVERARA